MFDKTQPYKNKPRFA